ncbi:MAG TPA: ferritin-like domain-containing protein [Luteitalea sp.]|nr:ferritin-like domain-containing protein [Luteitalea sp.]
MTKSEHLQNLVESGTSRRQFARNMMLGGAAAGAATFLGPIAELKAQSLSDVDILNFALNLEYLEAEFYTVATTGQRISEQGVGITGTGRSGDTVGGSRVSLNDRIMTVAMQIALDERNHVNFLRQALGNNAVAKPAINLAALNVGFNNANEFLTVARAFEDLGVSAYGGAAAFITNRSILTNAAQIALTEAQHAGVLRLLVSDAGIAVPGVDALDVLPLMSPNGRLFQVDGAGRSTIRTPGQVLAVAYGSANAGTRAGGFFPNGVNGPIASV